MSQTFPIRGVIAAAVTPLNDEFSPALDDLPVLLDFLARRGCHGALIMGTTGEGPSFSPSERLEVFFSALQVRQKHPDFHLLAGTGTPSLDETIELTRIALEMGFDAAVVLPPYYFRKVSDEGLFTWFSLVIRKAVPQGKYLLGYHFPGMTGVPLSLDLLARLKETFPDQFAGIKDSSSDAEFTRQLGERFGDGLAVFSGSDHLFSLALENHAAGCITALANVQSRDSRRVWEAHLAQEDAAQAAAQLRLDQARAIFSKYPPNPPLYKALLKRLFGLPGWSVRPPLLSIPAEELDAAVREINAAIIGFGS